MLKYKNPEIIWNFGHFDYPLSTINNLISSNPDVPYYIHKENSGEVQVKPVEQIEKMKQEKNTINDNKYKNADRDRYDNHNSCRDCKIL